MQQLSGLDTAFLTMEAGGQLGHVGSLCLFEASGLGDRSLLDAITHTIEHRLHLLPPYRRRLVEVPFGLDHPYWIEDPDFDLDYHVRHIAVPPPGDETQLASLVARIHGHPLDRARPLWEAYVIEGVANDLVGLYTKIHHCTIDGVSGAEMMTVLLDRARQGDEVAQRKGPWKVERVPGNAEMLARSVLGLASQPGRIARVAARTARDLWRSNEALGALARGFGFDRLPVAGGWLRRRGPQVDADPIPQSAAPKTPWNRSITPHRRFAYFSLPLDEVKRVKNAFGTSLNDAVMAISASALRRYLREHKALPKDPLVAMVPVSVRSESQRGEYTNRVTSVLGSLATDVDDPVERLERIHQAMTSAKRMQQALPANLLQDWAHVAMPALTAQAARIVARTRIFDRLNPPFNVVISNVPGPRHTLYLGGAELRAYYPVSAVAEGQGLNITVQSYQDHLDFGLIACRELVPDLWRFKELFGEGLEELSKRAAQATG
ncbi:MAG TPA: wax ester/triacylglycerol synthase family O-acyltransferase [Myxococcota bacterium]|jgi:WS/DGAT/MGAT family acyltransferase|nr:wax ester/triacylglycerol synthase family O-acyltransferase [Myxococcota bacterium]